MIRTIVLCMVLATGAGCAQISNTVSLDEARAARAEYVAIFADALRPPVDGGTVVPAERLQVLTDLIEASDVRIDALADKLFTQNYEQATRDWSLARDILSVLGLVGAVAGAAF